MNTKIGGIFLLAGVSCSGDDDGGGRSLGDQTDTASVVPNDTGTVAGSLPAGDRKPWTVFVYMAADNNLEGAAVDDFAEMQAGVGDDMNLVVMFDRSPDGEGGYSNDPIDVIGDFTGARLLHVTPTTVEDLGLRGDVTMTDPEVLVQVGTRVFTSYPADHAQPWLRLLGAV
jgi:hypothetical protein